MTSNRKWALILAAYALAAVFFSGQRVLTYVGRGDPVPLGSTLGSEFIYWSIWAVFTPAMLGFSRRFRIERSTRKISVAAHLLFGIVIAFVQIAVWKSIDLILFERFVVSQVLALPPQLRYAVLVGGWTSYYKYWIIIGIDHAVEVYARYREREREATRLQIQSARLEAELTQIQLDALRKQLHPHFLFNTMNTISVLMEEDVRKARHMLLRLSELLRVTLEYDGAHEVPLRQELDLLRHYLEIEQIRFEGRLSIHLAIDPQSLDARVPTLILQPLVENAIRHGIAPRAAAGHVIVRAERKGGELHLEVQDDGPGLADGHHAGIGLLNTQSRLAHLYSKSARLELLSAEGGGTVAKIVLPLHEAGDQA